MHSKYSLAKINLGEKLVLKTGLSVHYRGDHPEDELGQKAVKTLVNSLVCRGGSSAFRSFHRLPTLISSPVSCETWLLALENKRIARLPGPSPTGPGIDRSFPFSRFLLVACWWAGLMVKKFLCISTSFSWELREKYNRSVLRKA